MLMMVVMVMVMRVMQLLTLRNFAAVTKSVSPETRLMNYTASQLATSSINDCLFYVNVALLVYCGRRPCHD